jgi:hypothetical protein
MTGWLDYTIADLLLFGPDAYWGLFSQQNAALGAWAALPFVLGFLLLGLLLGTNRNRVRIALGCVALGWTGAAHFVFAYYATINWAIVPLGWVFLGYAISLAAASVLCPVALAADSRATRTVPGLLLFTLGGVLYPVVGLVLDRPFSQTEILGLTPDATALATLGLLAMAGPNRVSVGLAVPPVLWCGLSAITLFALGSPQGWFLVAGIFLWVGATWIGRMVSVGNEPV